MPAAVRLNPTAGRMKDGLQVASMLRVPRASGVIPDAQPE